MTSDPTQITMIDVPGWPGLSGHGPLLPDTQVDLAPLREIIVPGPRARVALTWQKDAHAHLIALAPEFGGQPVLDLLLAAAIVDVRRNGADGPGATLFHRLLAEGGQGLVTRLSLRWLRSVCDTLADHGPTPETRTLALTGSALVTATVAYESERKLFTPRRPWPPRKGFSKGGVLFDGVVSFHPETGDMLTNHFDRLERTAATDPIAGPFVAEIARRLRTEDTAFARLGTLSGKPGVPVLKGPGRRALRWLIRRLL